MLNILQQLVAAVERNEPAALATVVEVNGASPAKVGAKILTRGDGATVGTAGGGRLEQAIVADARAALAEGKSRLTHYTLREEGDDAIGVLCGGEVRVFIEVFAPRPTLLIVGGGHIGKPLAEMARLLNYEVRVVDVRDERGGALDPASITPHTYIVLVTEDYVSDEAALRTVIESPAPYIGMIGSRRKCRMVLEHLRADGVTENLLTRVRAPIGLDLGGTTPAEIALAILAEIEMARHQGRAESRSKG
jgi:xanthine dehydrogenase accessory factor